MYFLTVLTKYIMHTQAERVYLAYGLKVACFIMVTNIVLDTQNGWSYCICHHEAER